MKASNKNRLEKLEKFLTIKHSRRSVLIICDPKILHTLDISPIEAEGVIILPDNCLGSQPIPNGSYVVYWM